MGEEKGFSYITSPIDFEKLSDEEWNSLIEGISKYYYNFLTDSKVQAMLKRKIIPLKIETIQIPTISKSKDWYLVSIEIDIRKLKK